MKKFYLIILLFLTAVAGAQVTNEGTPLSWVINPSENPIAVKLPAFDLDVVKAEDAIDDGKFEKPWRFGYMHSVDYGFEDGQWTTLENGDRIWRLLVSSKDALSLNFVFDDFYLPKGGTLYLYSDDKQDLLGAYTSAQNQDGGILGTWLVKGDKVWIEYFEPANVFGQGRLHIAKTTHGYRNAETMNQTKDLNDSGDCNLDVDCFIGSDWESLKNHNKRSVGLILVGANSLCSGALINNTNNDGTPYFLTANHCFEADDTVAAWSFRFGWISPNPVCADTTDSTDGDTTQTISGAQLRARNGDSDFCLVEINNPIPTEWDPVFAGWDNTDDFPEFQVGIHHPSGDVMKVCRDDNPPVKTILQSVQTWDISEEGDNGGWELGVTEGGSSGSPLFDQDGKVIGQLFAGSAACSGVMDNDQSDFYGRFGISWDGGDSASERLRDWLDPNNVGVETLESFPLEEVFDLDGAVAATLPNVSCGVTTTTPTVILTNFGLNEITTATIDWNIDGGTNTTINFNGSLMQNESEIFILPEINLLEGENIINASLTLINGSDDDNLNNNEDSDVLTFLLEDLYTTGQVHLELLTDNFPQETTWEFRNIDGTLINAGGPYAEQNTVFLEDFDVNINECYVFNIIDSANDGICCGFGTGSYELTTDDDIVIFSGGEFEGIEITQISISGILGVDNITANTISIYPNPAKTILTIDLSDAQTDVNYSIANTLGQEVNSGSLKLSKTDINVESLESGIYFVTISDKINNTITKVLKFIKE